MSNRMDGRAVLSQFDGVIARARRALSDAISDAETLSRDLTQTRRDQAATYLELAQVQVSEADTPEEIRALSRLDSEVAELLDAQPAYLDKVLADLAAASAKLTELEAERAKGARTLDTAIAAYEDKVAEVEAELENDDVYSALVQAVDDAESVTEHARAKLALAREDMDEKGEIFRTDPLFIYLWKRGFRTPAYKAGPMVRTLDGWVAGLCNYDKSYRNYDRLIELPEWLDEHVASMAARESEAETALADAEAAALQAAGVDALSSVVDKARAELARIDGDIAATEAEHMEISQLRSAVMAGTQGPAADARGRLAEALRRLAFPDLRVLASGTVTPADDELVDRLVVLRKDEMNMELRLQQDQGQPGHRRTDLDLLEQFRRAFKSSNFDSVYALFTSAAVDDVIARLLSRQLDPSSALRKLSRNMQRARPRTDPRFGGRRRSETLGIPDVAVGIGMEILKEMGRSSQRGGSPWGGGGLPRGRRTSFPRPRSPSRPTRSSGGKRRGGFKTGGGF